MTLFRKGLALVATILIVQIALGVLLLALHQRIEDGAQSVERSHRTSTLISSTMSEMLNVRHSIALRPVNVAAMAEAFIRLSDRLDALRTELRSQADRASIIADVQNHVKKGQWYVENGRRMILTHTFKVNSRGNFWTPLAHEMRGIVTVAGTLNAILHEEQAISEAALAREESERRISIMVTAVAMGLEVLLILLVVLWFNRDITGRMRILVENTERISHHLPLLKKVRGDDEIFHLDDMIRQVAEAVTTAEKNDLDLVDQQRDIIVCLNEKLELITSNRVCQDEFELGHGQRTVQSIADIVHEGDLAQVMRCFQSLKADDHVQFEARIINKDGKTLDAFWSARWSSTDRTFFCVVHDITAHKQAERLRQEVLQMVGHDLKSPLGAVGGFLELFEAKLIGDLSPEGQGLVESALMQTKRMSAVIKDLLKLETIRAGMFALQCEHMSLDGLVQRTALAIRDIMAKSETFIEIAPGGLEVYADEAGLTEALNILLVNAAVRSAKQTKIEVDSRKIGDSIVVRVIDYGRTIPSHELAQIFEPFRAATKSGSSLSLALCRAIMEAHGGKISAQSQAGAGTIFTLSLPV